jgi:hypothetical protein
MGFRLVLEGEKCRCRGRSFSFPKGQHSIGMPLFNLSQNHGWWYIKVAAQDCEVQRARHHYWLTFRDPKVLAPDFSPGQSKRSIQPLWNRKTGIQEHDAIPILLTLLISCNLVTMSHLFTPNEINSTTQQQGNADGIDIPRWMWAYTDEFPYRSPPPVSAQMTPRFATTNLLRERELCQTSNIRN